ncbi:MAG: sugar-binding transcriptional regulator [Acidobacteria bacterium]|nr:sugar-binding transcriptional regulator [Acidobacteriota bacterium]
MGRVDELRLIAKVARMYYIQELNQQEITDKLQLHQSTISRMLKKARALNLVRFNIATPPGTFADLEDQLTSRFELKDAVVVDCPAEGEAMFRDLGIALAYFLETTLKPGKVIGISSWSRSLFAMVDALHPGGYCADGKVVQILGGVGNTASDFHAIHLAQRLAGSIGAKPVLLQSPAVVGTSEAQRVLSRDPVVQEASALFDKLDLALVGIGSMEPSKMLAVSGNIFSREERAKLQRLGAVGDICFRFYNADGQPIKSSLMKRVIGIDLDKLSNCKRVVGVAGGTQKMQAILGALRGGLIDVLITDQRTAEVLSKAKN